MTLVRERPAPPLLAVGYAGPPAQRACEHGPAGRKRSSRERATLAVPARIRSRPERAPRLAALFIQLAVEVQTLEDELDGGGDRRRIAGSTELRDGALHPGDLQRLLHVLAGCE